MAGKILHLMCNDKFNATYIDFINQRFSPNCHLFAFTGGVATAQIPIPDYHNCVEWRSNHNLIYQLLFQLIMAKKIIIHGLFDHRVIILLFLLPWLLRKTSWVIWGADLYCDVNPPQKSTLKSKLFRRLKKFVCSHFNSYITYIDGDYNLAKELYGGNAKFEECIMYLSNTFTATAAVVASKPCLTILVGNSATESNNHIEALTKLKAENLGECKIICPLNYGNKDYAAKVLEYGTKLFGTRFEPLLNFIPLAEYKDLLATVDVALFNHNRQQGMGNIINLLGMGKTVYIRSNVTTWSFFQKSGIQVFDMNQETLNIREALSVNLSTNQKKIADYFNLNNLFWQLNPIFCE